MSLKAFHCIFVGSTLLLALFCTVWFLKEFFTAGRALGDLLAALGSAALGVGVWFYGQYFLKKLKHISYL